MFDDYVEHVGSTVLYVGPQIGQQGFEGNSVNELNSALSAMPKPSPSPIFELGSVEFPGGIPAPIVAIAVCSDILAAAFANNQIYILDLQKPEHIMKLEVPKKTYELTIRRLFLDPTGKHLLLNFTQGETWYFHRGWKKPKPLKRFNSSKLIIESVAWNRVALLSLNSNVTGPFLLGTANGAIYETYLDAGDDFFKSQEKFLRLLFTTREGTPVVGIGFELFPPADIKKCLVIAVTPSRIYQFSGLQTKSIDASESFHSTFSKYKDSEPLTFEIPGEYKHSQMHFRNNNPDQIDSLSSSLCWSTGSGIYHGALNFRSTSEDFLDAAELLPYPVSTGGGGSEGSDVNAPVSMCFTEFHFIYLYPDRVVSVGILDRRQDYEERLTLKPGERVLGLVMDSSKSTYWLFTNSSLFELLAVEEDRDVWSAYLNKNDHVAALKYAKNVVQKNAVVLSQAKSLFTEGKYLEAAQAFSQTTASFEEVVLDFINSNQTDALRAYLSSKLDGTRKTDLAKRMMLTTWLVELYLRKYSDLEDTINAGLISQDMTDRKEELIRVENEFRTFLQVNTNALDAGVIYDLLRSHGRDEFLLHYAALMGDFDLVIEHWINEEDWEKALNAISGQTNPEMHYKYAAVLMRKAPRLVTDAWLRLPSLDPARLLPALLQQSQTKMAIKHAIRYLHSLVFEAGNTATPIHNALVTLYISSTSESDEVSFMKYLSQAPKDSLTTQPYYDSDYALRLCLQHNRIRPSVLLYSDMGLWEECVDLALSKELYDLAKLYADKPDNEPTLRKKLWLKIVRCTLEKRMDVNSAMQLLTETDAIKIEDILPFFPDFIVIDEFKDVICQALQNYSQHINLLKSEMDEAGESAESLKQDITELHKRFITLETSAKCSKCLQTLLSRQFYVFPCQHSFHADCLIALMKSLLQPSGLRKMLALQVQLLQSGLTEEGKSRHDLNSKTSQNLLSSAFGQEGFSVVGAAGSLGRGVLSAGDRLREMIVPESLANLTGGWTNSPVHNNTHLSKKELALHTRLQEELDEIIAASCPLCDSLVNDLEKDYIDVPNEAETWRI